MTVVLLTGMSGTGKTTALAELARRGHRTIDTDYGDWCTTDGPEPLWRTDRIDALLTGHTQGTLFVSGTVANQGAFYSRFTAIVLLSAPIEVMLARIAARDTNDFGKTENQRRQIIEDTAQVEPLLRAGATHEIDTRIPVTEVAARLEAIAAKGLPRPVRPSVGQRVAVDDVGRGATQLRQLVDQEFEFLH